jgi:hypothetical protein
MFIKKDIFIDIRTEKAIAHIEFYIKNKMAELGKLYFNKHYDGTIGEYFHIKKNGIYVVPDRK